MLVSHIIDQLNVLPPAARQFHVLNQAYELLLDPLRRLVLDAKLRLKEARKTRFANYDAKRRTMVDELEERERAFKKAKVERAAADRAQAQETERIKDEGRKLREEREKALKRMEEEAERAAEKTREELEPPSLGTPNLYFASHPKIKISHTSY